jgi:hypothetical protein
LSFFPSGHLQYQHIRFTALYESVLESWTRCESVWDLYALLVKEAASFIFRQDNKRFTDLVETYRWAIGTKAASQTSYFEEYSRSHSAGDLSDSTALDDRRELHLVLDFADIIDELNMIRHLAEKQRDVIKSLATALRKLHPAHESPTNHGGIFYFQGNTFDCRGKGRQKVVVNLNQGGTNIEAELIRTIAEGIKGAASKTIVSADETLDLLLAELSAMRKDAEYSHKMACFTLRTHPMERGETLTYRGTLADGSTRSQTKGRRAG